MDALTASGPRPVRPSPPSPPQPPKPPVLSTPCTPTGSPRESGTAVAAAAGRNVCRAGGSRHGRVVAATAGGTATHLGGGKEEGGGERFHRDAVGVWGVSALGVRRGAPAGMRD